MSDPNWTNPDGPLEPGMAGSLVTNTVLFAISRGIETQQLERATGLSIDELAALDRRFPSDTLAQVWRCLLDNQPGVCLPLEMIRFAPQNYFGPLAFGVHYADSLHTALNCMLRYRKLLSSDLQAGMDINDEEATWWFRHPTDDLDDGAAALVGLALGSRFIHDLLAMPDAIVRIEIAHGPIGSTAEYEAHFRVPVVYETKRNAMVLRTASLDERPSKGNPELFIHIKNHLDRAWEQLRVADELAPVREAIAALAQRSEYSAEALAKRLGMSLRVLQRHVAAHGSTVRELLDEAREANARALLQDRQLSVEEVAFLLGYSDERAFRRAFKRTSGSTPVQFRRSI